MRWLSLGLFMVALLWPQTSVVAFPAGRAIAVADKILADDWNHFTKVIVICDREPLSNGTRTWFCRDGHICKSIYPRPAKRPFHDCDWGPEIKRKLQEAEQRRMLERARARAAQRAVERERRAEEVRRTSNEQRGTTECGATMFMGNSATLCVGDAARNVTGPIDYSGMNDSRRVPSTQHDTGGRVATTAPTAAAKVQRAAAVRASLQERNARRMGTFVQDMVQHLVANGHVSDAEKYIADLQRARTQADSGDPNLAPLDRAIARGKQLIAESRKSREGVLPPPSQPVAAPEPPRPAQREEALCSFMLDLAQDRSGRPSGPIPDDCRAYSAYIAAIPPLPDTAATPNTALPRPIIIPEEETRGVLELMSRDLGLQ